MALQTPVQTPMQTPVQIRLGDDGGQDLPVFSKMEPQVTHCGFFHGWNTTTRLAALSFTVKTISARYGLQALDSLQINIGKALVVIVIDSAQVFLAALWKGLPLSVPCSQCWSSPWSSPILCCLMCRPRRLPGRHQRRAGSLSL